MSCTICSSHSQVNCENCSTEVCIFQNTTIDTGFKQRYFCSSACCLAKSTCPRCSNNTLPYLQCVKCSVKFCLNCVNERVLNNQKSYMCWTCIDSL